MPVSTFVVSRENLQLTQWLNSPSQALEPGQVRCRIDLFSLTANNITYGAFGSAMRYFDFFPVAQSPWACIPAWGFATVTESRSEAVTEGERLYGFWPMANQAVLEPVRADAIGFTDGRAHRRELHSVYNRYMRIAADVTQSAQTDAVQSILKPLVTTSFLIDDFLAAQEFFGATQVLLSSASSKTAWSTAFFLSQRKGGARGAIPAPDVVGLTSASRLAFVESLGCYDKAVDYAALGSLNPELATVYVDFSGDAAVRRSVHTHFGEHLAYSCSVGGTHWESLGSGQGLPGPRPVLFFAPAQAKTRTADWGAQGLAARLDSAWKALIQVVEQPESPWLTVVQGKGSAAVEEAYSAVLQGKDAPAVGRVLTV